VDKDAIANALAVPQTRTATVVASAVAPAVKDAHVAIAHVALTKKDVPVHVHAVNIASAVVQNAAIAAPELNAIAPTV